MCWERCTWRRLVLGEVRSAGTLHCSPSYSLPPTPVCSFRRRRRGRIIEGTQAFCSNAKILHVCSAATVDSSPPEFLSQVLQPQRLFMWLVSPTKDTSRHEWFGKREAHLRPSMYISYYLQIIDAQILDSASFPLCCVSFHLCTACCNVISNPLSLSLSFSAV